MRKFMAVPTAAGALAVILAAAPPRQGGAAPPLTVSAARFYQPASGTTTIEGVCEVRLAAMQAGASQVVRYRIEVAVRDSAGLELQKSSWAREVPAAAARASAATAVESFSFRAAPGRYRVEVRAVPDGGAAVERDIEVRAYGAQPPISDLLLGTAARRLASDTEALNPGEVRRAGMAMRSAPAPRLSPTEAALAYYAEVYPWAGAATSGELRVEVVGAGGRTIVQTPPRALQVDPTGGLTRGSLDLTGLPEGEYRFRLRLRIGDSTLVAEAPFAMAGLAATAATVAAQAPAATAATAATAPAGGGDRFDEADEARLDSLYAPLIYLLDQRTEQGVYERLSVAGKRNFLREFWRRRDPTPSTADNPAMADFYRSVSYVNGSFREGGAGQIPGWRTDRGRIYLKHGAPDEVLRRLMASPRPYEVWRYTRGRPLYYVFYDQSSFGHYVLLGTNDRREAGQTAWEEYLGPEGSQDVLRFLGLQRERQP